MTESYPQCGNCRSYFATTDQLFAHFPTCPGVSQVHSAPRAGNAPPAQRSSTPTSAVRTPPTHTGLRHWSKVLQQKYGFAHENLGVFSGLATLQPESRFYLYECALPKFTFLCTSHTQTPTGQPKMTPKEIDTLYKGHAMRLLIRYSRIPSAQVTDPLGSQLVVALTDLRKQVLLEIRKRFEETFAVELAKGVMCMPDGQLFASGKELRKFGNKYLFSVDLERALRSCLANDICPRASSYRDQLQADLMFVFGFALHTDVDPDMSNFAASFRSVINDGLSNFRSSLNRLFSRAGKIPYPGAGLPAPSAGPSARQMALEEENSDDRNERLFHDNEWEEGLSYVEDHPSVPDWLRQPIGGPPSMGTALANRSPNIGDTMATVFGYIQSQGITERDIIDTAGRAMFPAMFPVSNNDQGLANDPVPRRNSDQGHTNTNHPVPRRNSDQGHTNTNHPVSRRNSDQDRRNDQGYKPDEDLVAEVVRTMRASGKSDAEIASVTQNIFNPDGREKGRRSRVHVDVNSDEDGSQEPTQSVDSNDRDVSGDSHSNESSRTDQAGGDAEASSDSSTASVESVTPSAPAKKKRKGDGAKSDQQKKKAETAVPPKKKAPKKQVATKAAPKNASKAAGTKPLKMPPKKSPEKPAGVRYDVVVTRSSVHEALGMTLGFRSGAYLIERISPKTPAARSVLQIGMQVLTMNGSRVDTKEQVSANCKRAKDLSFAVLTTPQSVKKIRMAEPEVTTPFYCCESHGAVMAKWEAGIISSIARYSGPGRFLSNCVCVGMPRIRDNHGNVVYGKPYIDRNGVAVEAQPLRRPCCRAPQGFVDVANDHDDVCFHFCKECKRGYDETQERDHKIGVLCNGCFTDLADEGPTTRRVSARKNG
jgi:hypothetical protein